MLRQLSGRTHQVISGVCVLTPPDGSNPGEESITVSTDVVMKELSDAEIARYVATGEPMDKAGAYAIQGGAAYMVRSIRGSYTNVVGLPLAELSQLLDAYGKGSAP
jgi:septum formation protein